MSEVSTGSGSDRVSIIYEVEIASRDPVATASGTDLIAVSERSLFVISSATFLLGEHWRRTEMAADKSRAVPAILLGGLVAGTLDISYACIFSYLRRGVRPIAVLQSVASGALGAKASEGGIKTAILGLCFHFLIALIATSVYYFASRVLRFMVTHAVISGILYGVCVYLVMYGIVLRVSAIHSTRYPWSYPWPLLVGNLLIHMLGIGLSIALVVRKFSK